MRHGIPERLARPFRDQPARIGWVLIAVGVIDVVLRDGFGVELIARDTHWLSDVPILVLGVALVLYGRLRRPRAGGASWLLLLLLSLAMRPAAEAPLPAHPARESSPVASS